MVGSYIKTTDSSLLFDNFAKKRANNLADEKFRDVSNTNRLPVLANYLDIILIELPSCFNCCSLAIKTVQIVSIVLQSS